MPCLCRSTSEGGARGDGGRARAGAALARDRRRSRGEHRQRACQEPLRRSLPERRSLPDRRSPVRRSPLAGGLSPCLRRSSPDRRSPPDRRSLPDRFSSMAASSRRAPVSPAACYHPRGPQSRAFSRRCRTSSNRRSAFARPPASGARTCAGARPRRRSCAACARPPARATRRALAERHRELVSWLDKAAARGTLHTNTAARRKAQAARILRRLRLGCAFSAGAMLCSAERPAAEPPSSYRGEGRRDPVAQPVGLRLPDRVDPPAANAPAAALAFGLDRSDERRFQPWPAERPRARSERGRRRVRGGRIHAGGDGEATTARAAGGRRSASAKSAAALPPRALRSTTSPRAKIAALRAVTRRAA